MANTNTKRVIKVTLPDDTTWEQQQLVMQHIVNLASTVTLGEGAAEGAVVAAIMQESNVINFQEIIDEPAELEEPV